MIGYVLLVGIVIIMSLIVFQFIRTYVPKDVLKCPDEVSVFIQETKYDCTAKTLEVTIKNNGRFNIAGYFIHATTSEDQELATLDLSGTLENQELKYLNSVVFTYLTNFLEPNKAIPITFIDVGDLENHKIEIIPVRFQEEEGKKRFVSCGDAKVGEVLSCWVEPEECTDERLDSEVCGTRECGTVLDNCNVQRTCLPDDCATRDPSMVCDGTGTCVPEGECEDLRTDSEVCGSRECGVALDDCNVQRTCLPDDCVGIYGGGYVCDGTGQCVSDCGDGNQDPGEVCDDGINNGQNGYCWTDCTRQTTYCGDGMVQDPNDNSENEQCDDGNANSGDGCYNCQTELGWICIGEPSECTSGGAPSCIIYCLNLELEYTSSNCPANVGQCNSQNGDSYAGGYSECTARGAEGNYVCCCKPAL